jgi:mono/diheme cytochrome c family protein
MKPFLLLSATVLFAIAPALIPGRLIQDAAPAATAEPNTPLAYTVKNPVTPTPASQAKAKEIYARDCALCHGDNGTGKSEVATSMQLTLTDWTDPKSLTGKQDGELFDIIRTGWDKMPPEAEGRASDAEVWNIIIYIRGLSKGPHTAPASPAN